MNANSSITFRTSLFLNAAMPTFNSGRQLVAPTESRSDCQFDGSVAPQDILTLA
jgi:hypothetical protein